MDVLVVGLGRFGAAAALELRRLGHKVTAIERDGFLAEKFLGRLSHVIHGDASDVQVIRDAKAGRFQKAVVAIAKAISDAYADPNDKTGKLFVVDVAPEQKLSRPVTLAEIKSDKAFASFPLVRMSRLSVMPVTDAEWTRIEKMSRS